ncbi:MAG: hypothetical protein LBT59_15560, partial [Clostridiales bacterium]|nr:hypothetical protein [Clostridiales bacterium]
GKEVRQWQSGTAKAKRCKRLMEPDVFRFSKIFSGSQREKGQGELPCPFRDLVRLGDLATYISAGPRSVKLLNIYHGI